MTISEIKDKVKSVFYGKPILKAWVFGSISTSSNHPGSDVDILVELDSTKQIGLIEFIKIQVQLEQVLKSKVDLICSDAVSKFIAPFIEQQKQLIYEEGTRG